jgi:hypothetical protein
MADNDKDNPEQQAPDVMGEAARWRSDADMAADAPPGVSRGQSETGDNTASAADTTADIIAASGSPEAAETTAQHDLLSAAPSEGTGVTGNVHANDPKQSRWPRISRLFLRSTWQGK